MAAKASRKSEPAAAKTAARPTPATAFSSAAGTNAFDRVIHERLRLGIVTALAVNEWMTFAELKGVLGTTDGNLSVHARKLEDVHYIECRKSFADRMPKSEYRLTREGRKALERYLDHMDALIRATRGR
jgi:DNA-binding MarR family transcriptional regulator